MFIGRERELALLDSEYTARRSSMVVVYGRRRVGKSELLLELLRSRQGIYFVGKQAPAPMQLRELLREAARVLDEPLLANMPTDDWKAALSTIVERGTRVDDKLILVLDELPWTAEAAPELPSVLQELWDRSWKKSGNVMLILCGSYLGFMEREVLGNKSPLFGRRTKQVRLQPFEPVEAGDFHPRWSRRDQASAYFVCGGIPLYLEMFDSDLSIRQNIEATLLEEFAPLFREPEFLLRTELRELENYYAVLLSLAAGSSTLAELERATGIGRGSVHYYTQTLADLGYIAKRYPLVDLDRKPAARHVRFSIEDPLLRFWFRFVFPNQSSVAHLGPRRAFDVHIKAELTAYFGTCFERLCRQRLPALYRDEEVSARYAVGEYWSTKAQIDVVGVRDDNWTDIGECKWGHVRSVAGLRRELAAKVAAFPNDRGATVFRRFFVRDRPKRLQEQAGERWHSLEELYEHR